MFILQWFQRVSALFRKKAILPVPQLRVVSSVKFEVLLPVTYTDPNDPTKTAHPVQLQDVAKYLSRMTAQYGGYTMSNPVGPPPYAGAFQGGSQERNFWVMIIVPDGLLNQAQDDVQQMISHFQTQYYQQEILCYCYHITRYQP
jgi:hypothetical protein